MLFIGQIRKGKVAKKDVATATKVDGSKDEMNENDDFKCRYRAIDFLINPMRAFQRFSKHLKTKDGVESKFLIPNETLCAFPVSPLKNEKYTESKSV